MEGCFGLEMDQFKEGTGSNALHQDPASHVPCSLQSDAGHPAVSACFFSWAHLLQLKGFCSTFQKEKLGGGRYETYPNV